MCWVDTVVGSKNEEGIASSILSVKALDNLNEYDGV